MLKFAHFLTQYAMQNLLSTSIVYIKNKSFQVGYEATDDRNFQEIKRNGQEILFFSKIDKN
jgi:hypothetical protein